MLEGTAALATHFPVASHLLQAQPGLGLAQLPHKENKTNTVFAQRVHHGTCPKGQSADIHWLLFDTLLSDLF